MNSDDVITFWFDELQPRDWWKKSDELDNTIRERFGAVHRAAIQAELFDWRDSPTGRLAEIIVIDQFSRNIFRGQAESFAYDGMAVILTQEAVTAGADAALDGSKKSFLYMPLMHSESPRLHEWALQLFDQPGLESNLAFERKHKAIIDRFGRYPHRNEILGRTSTAEEVEFLQQPGSSF